jgi:surfeit locus 1 family protein
MTKYRTRVALVPTLAALVVLSVTVSLGNWQMRRADEKALAQAQRDAALAADPVAVAANRMPPEAVDGRRVSLTGTFDPARTVFLDNRTRQGIAGVHVFTPLRLAPEGGDDGHWVLVLRGWSARDPFDRSRLPEVPTPPGRVEVEGLAQSTLAQALMLAPAPPPAAHERLWALITLSRYAEWSGLPLQPFFVRQTSALDDGLARDWVQPGGGVATHRGYAFQWYSLAAATLALWVWFGFLRRSSTRHQARTDADSTKAR